MSSTAAATEVFDFFGLARELRDQIYDEMLSPVRSIFVRGSRWPAFLEVLAHGTPAMDLALVSRQFREEYCARSALAISVIIDDYLDPSDDIVRVQLPVLLSACTQLRINTPMTSYTLQRALDGDEAYPTWIPHILRQMASLQSCKIALRFYTYSNGGVDAAKRAFPGHCAAFSPLSEVTSVQLFTREDHTGYTNIGKPHMTWSRESGTLEEVCEEEAE